VADLQDYLDLYVKFKVKVAAAQDARIDTVPEVRKDLKNYLDQLYNSYLDKLVLQPLMDEVRDRWKVDVRSRHILVSVPRGAGAEAENEAYEKIMKIRERIVNGEDFEKVALETSDDRYVQRNKGDLGYVNVMRLPYYEFENKLYNTDVGDVSMPVRTPLGYHIIMPTQRRPAVGSVEVAHILVEVSPEADEEAVSAAREKIETVHGKLKEGATFGKLARQYSDDEMTKTNEGRMEPFSAGEMVPIFENEAFSLTGDSSFTDPFRTRYGYHILMLLNKKEKSPFKENEARIRREVKKDSRYQKSLDAKKTQFMKEYGFVEMDANLAYIAAELDSSVYRDGFSMPQVEDTQALFEIDGKEYNAADLYRHIERYQPYNRKKSFQDITEENTYDLIYFDAFGARVQPDLWTADIFGKMYRALRVGGVLVTYAAKGSVRRAMQEVGFQVERLPGPPGKREMLRAAKKPL
jgi:peptidyl-prolyl cis-trans isomerase SurA